MNNDKNENKIYIEEAINKAGFGLYSYILITMTGALIIAFVCIAHGNTILVPASACELNTTGAQQGILVAAPTVASILGTMVWGYLADTRGRRKMIFVALLGGAFVNLITSISVNWIMFMILQFTAALFTGGLFSMSMSLLSECVPMAKRNSVVLLATSIFLLSQGLMAVLAIPIIPLTFSYYLPALGIYWNSWRTLTLVYSGPAILVAIWLFFMQESPKFVFTKGDEHGTLEILRKIHKVNHLRSSEEYSIKSILQEVVEQKEGPSSAKDQIVPLFKQPLLKYTIIMLVLFLFQQLGAFAIWLPTIANQFVSILETGEGLNQTLCGVIGSSADLPPDPDAVPCALNTTSLLLVLAVGAMQSFFNFLSSLVVNKVGRRNMVMVVTSVCGISGILVNLIPNAIGSVVMFVVMLIGLIVFGLYTAIIIALFPTNLRVMAIALPQTCGRIGSFAVIQILNLLLANNCDVGFYLFSSIFATSAIVASFLPDDRLLYKQNAKPKSEFLDLVDNETPRNATQL